MWGTFWLCFVSPVLTACAQPKYRLTSSGEKPLRDLRAEKRGKMQPTTTLFALYRSLSSCRKKHRRPSGSTQSLGSRYRRLGGKLCRVPWKLGPLYCSTVRRRSPLAASLSNRLVRRSPEKLFCLVIIIMYIYHAVINALSAHMIHINLNMIFYTHVKHGPTKTIYIKYYKNI